MSIHYNSFFTWFSNKFSSFPNMAHCTRQNNFIQISNINSYLKKKLIWIPNEITFKQTPYSRVHLQKLRVEQSVNKFPVVKVTRMFITVFTKFPPLVSMLRYMIPVHTLTPASYFFVIHFNNILPFMIDLQIGLFPSRLPTNILYACFIYPIHAICLANLIYFIRLP